MQGARGRSAGLRVEERIVLHLDGSGLVTRGHRRAPRGGGITAETLAVELSVFHGADAGTRTEVDGLELVVGVERR